MKTGRKGEVIKTKSSRTKIGMQNKKMRVKNAVEQKRGVVLVLSCLGEGVIILPHSTRELRDLSRFLQL